MFLLPFQGWARLFDTIPGLAPSACHLSPLGGRGMGGFHFPAFALGVARARCRPLKGTRVIPPQLSRQFRAGFSRGAASRLEYRVVLRLLLEPSSNLARRN